MQIHIFTFENFEYFIFFLYILVYQVRKFQLMCININFVTNPYMFLITIKKRKLYINSLHFNIIFCNCGKKKATYRYFDAVSSFIFKNRILEIIT